MPNEEDLKNTAAEPTVKPTRNDEAKEKKKKMLHYEHGAVQAILVVLLIVASIVFGITLYHIGQASLKTTYLNSAVGNDDSQGRKAVDDSASGSNVKNHSQAYLDIRQAQGLLQNSTLVVGGVAAIFTIFITGLGFISFRQFVAYKQEIKDILNKYEKLKLDTGEKLNTIESKLSAADNSIKIMVKDAKSSFEKKLKVAVKDIDTEVKRINSSFDQKLEEGESKLQEVKTKLRAFHISHRKLLNKTVDETESKLKAFKISASTLDNDLKENRKKLGESQKAVEDFILQIQSEREQIDHQAVALTGRLEGFEQSMRNILTRIFDRSILSIVVKLSKEGVLDPVEREELRDIIEESVSLMTIQSGDYHRCKPALMDLKGRGTISAIPILKDFKAALEYAEIPAELENGDPEFRKKIENLVGIAIESIYSRSKLTASRKKFDKIFGLFPQKEDFGDREDDSTENRFIPSKRVANYFWPSPGFSIGEKGAFLSAILAFTSEKGKYHVLVTQEETKDEIGEFRPKRLLASSFSKSGEPLHTVEIESLRGVNKDSIAVECPYSKDKSIAMILTFSNIEFQDTNSPIEEKWAIHAETGFLSKIEE